MPEPQGPEGPSDEQLMAQVQRLDRAAYDALYARYATRLMSYLQRRVGNRAHAEELHQELWLRVFEKRDLYDTARPFRPWVYTIAARLRTRGWRPAPHDYSNPTEVGLPDERWLVVQALSKLKPKDREILVLSLEDFDDEQLAAILGKSVSAVRVARHRARARLKDELEAQP